VKPLVFAALVAGCSASTDIPPGGLDARQILRRASLDIRGRLPTLDELDAVVAHPDALDATIDGYLRDPDFATSVRDLFARAYRTRFATYFKPGGIPNVSYGVDPAFQAAAAEEPLMLIADIAANDRPFTDVVTANETYVNESTAAAWPVAGYDSARGGWQRVHYADGRPAAGVLAMDAMWFRYSTCGQNYNRGRANAVSRILLCENYLQRPIDFPRDVNLTDGNAIRTAVATNVACTSCHSTLDPLASHLFGFHNTPDGDPVPGWSQTTASDWQAATGQPPGYMGTPDHDLAGLATQIAADPRFVRCATTRVYENLIGRAATEADFDAISRHEQAFRDGGLTLRALYRSVVRDPVYRGAADGDRPAIAHKLMSPEVLQSAVANLTGFAPTSSQQDVMRNDPTGLHVLGGGLDARSGDTPPALASTSRVLVHQRVAEAAADHELSAPATSRRLLAGVDMTTAPSGDQLAAWVARTQGISRDAASAFAGELAALFAAVRADGQPVEQAWIAVISAVLRDPEFVNY
jgi:hypothetical protein